LLERFFRQWLRSTGATRRASARDSGHAISLCHALLSERGEVSGAHRAVEALTAYLSLDSSAKEAFFDRLVDEFSPDPLRVERAIRTYTADPSPVNLVQLQRDVESPRQELFRRFNMAPGATAVLVTMRERLLTTLATRPERRGLDADLEYLFRSWFNRGFLVLQRIDWRTPALVLERLIEYEAVHQIQGWRDLRRRLAEDRRCYAFFHPALPDQPLIFIEVALTHGLAACVQPLLNPEAPIADPSAADCATFYSITNCQKGLQGVSFGNFLIKQVADDLGREFPRLKTFATLSPIPGFTRWLKSGGASAHVHMSPQVQHLLEQVERGDPLDLATSGGKFRSQITALCAYYLLHAKRGHEPLDPIARFHLANGARVERLNWAADTSPRGVGQSLGLMVNYVYRLSDVERNHEAYARECRIATSTEFQRLVKAGPRHVSAAPATHEVQDSMADPATK
jgi:malonyl-CoA decarboxylase